MVIKPSVYLETTIVSYLTAAPSRDPMVAGHQKVTLDWWLRRMRFDFFVSQAVIDEAAKGDPTAARRRLAVIEGIPSLTVTAECRELAARLLHAHALPETALLDAVHIAVAVVNGMDYVLTWNCTHLANAAMRPRIERALRQGGFDPAIICTPEELME